MYKDPCSVLGSSLKILLPLTQPDNQLSGLASEGVVTAYLKYPTHSINYRLRLVGIEFTSVRGVKPSTTFLQNELSVLQQKLNKNIEIKIKNNVTDHRRTGVFSSLREYRGISRHIKYRRMRRPH